MPRRQSSRLGYLMDKFCITGNEFAKILNVHCSLISKWRNGEREIRRNSPYLKPIIKHFVSLDSATRYHTLKEILKDFYPDVKLDSPQMISSFLGKWISDNQYKYHQSELLLNTGIPQHRKKFYRAQYDIYKGNDGRRDAVMRILNIVLSLPEGQELLIFSQQDMSWLIEDTNFLKDWNAKYLDVLRKGTHIIIVHCLDRQPNALLQTLIHWLPLHMTGRTSPYYYPKYTNTPLKTTYTIIRDQIALSSTSVDGLSTNVYTNIYSDTAAVQQLQTAFDSIVRQSRPLFEKYSSKKFFKLLDNIGNAVDKHENSYFYNVMPFFASFSRDTFQNILIENNFDLDSTSISMGFYDSLNEQFHKSIEGNCYRFIYDVSVLQQALIPNEAFSRNISLLMGFPLNLSPKFFEHFQQMIKLMDDNPYCEVALIPDQPISSLKDVNLWLKENTITIANTKEGRLSALISELTVVNILYYYYDDLWNSIPRIQRSKEWVKKKLSDLANRSELDRHMA